MTILFKDTFTGANNTLITAHVPDIGTARWVIASGSPAGIINNQLQVTSMSSSDSMPVVNIGTAFVKFTFTWSTVHAWNGALLRSNASGSSTYWFGTDGLYDVNGTKIGNMSTPANGDIFVISFNTDNTITITKNGTQIISTSSTTGLTNTYYGFSMGVISAGFDDLTIEDFSTGGTPTYTDGSTSFNTNQSIYRDSSTAYDTKQALYRDSSTVYDTKQAIYNDSSVSFDTQQIITPAPIDGSVAFDTKQAIYSDSSVQFDTLQQIQLAGIDGSATFDTKQAIYSDSSVSFATKQALYRDYQALFDTKQTFYIGGSLSFDTLQIIDRAIPVDGSLPFDTLQVIYRENIPVVYLSFVAENSISLSSEVDNQVSLTCEADNKVVVQCFMQGQP